MASPPALSRQRSHSTSIPDSTDHLSTNSTTTQWTDEQEIRLQHCKVELAKAHKRWSASQELWIEEVDRLSDLKKAHLKATKKTKQDAQAKKVVGIWKKKTWRKTLSRKSSKVDTNIPTPPIDGQNDADDETEEDDADEEALISPINRTDSMPEHPTSPSRTSPTSPTFPTTHQTRLSRRSSLSNAVRRLSIAGLRGSGGLGGSGGRRKTSNGNSNAVSASQSGSGTPALEGAFGFD